MAFARKLFVNWHTRSRQRSDLSSNPDPVETLGFLKYEQVPFEVVIVEPNPSGGLHSYQRVDITDLSLKMAINDTLDDATPLAEQTSWTKDTSTNTFSGILSLNTVAMNTYIDGDKTPYFELEITDSNGARFKILSESCNVAKGVLQTTTTSPDPAKLYLTYEEILGIFAPRVMGPGETITWRSPDGTIHRIFGVRDDGSPQDDSGQ